MIGGSPKRATGSPASVSRPFLIVAAVSAVILVAVIVLVAVFLFEPTPTEVDMAAVATYIDEYEIGDFAESDRAGDYVKLTVKDYGEIVIRLRGDVAPKTAAYFRDLVGEGYYDGTTFYRVREGFIIKGGDPWEDRFKAGDERVEGEFSENGYDNTLSHVRGVISMARREDDPDSGAGQFFICHAANAGALDGKYASFGYVVAGMDVVDAIAAAKTGVTESGENDETPVRSIVIEKAVFVTKKLF